MQPIKKEIKHLQAKRKGRAAISSSHVLSIRFPKIKYNVSSIVRRQLIALGWSAGSN